MQFPVPQFTDVEDKIIGPLTLKQFGIVFGAGIIIFLAFSTTKSLVVTIFFGLVVGIPALTLAFAKMNGRPIYKNLGHVANFILSPKVLVFHKETNSTSTSAKFKDADVKNKEQAANAAPAPPVDPQARLQEVNKLLQKQAQEEQELLKQIRK